MNTDAEYAKIAHRVLRHYGQPFARVKPKRGLKKEFCQAHKKRKLIGRCFENSLQLAHWSGNGLNYCEGFARLTMRNSGQSHWFRHAWVSYQKYDHNFALDLTWPWSQTLHTEAPDKILYFGLTMPSYRAREFFRWLEYQGVTNVMASIFRYADYYEAFLNEMH